MHPPQYHNYPVLSVNARANDRNMIADALAGLTDDSDDGEILRLGGHVLRKPWFEHKIEPAPAYKRDQYLATEALFAIVPRRTVAHACNLHLAELDRWKSRVPYEFCEFLKDLMAWYPRIGQVMKYKAQGMTSQQACKRVRVSEKDAYERTTYFNLFPAVMGA